MCIVLPNIGVAILSKNYQAYYRKKPKQKKNNAITTFICKHKNRRINNYIFIYLYFKRCNLHTKVYIGKNQQLQTTVYREETDRQSFLHSKSEQLLSLKKSILFGQDVRLK